MRIGIDGRPLLAIRSGIGKYTYELAINLKHLSNSPEISLFYGYYWSDHLIDRNPPAGEPYKTSLRDKLKNYVPDVLKKRIKKGIINREFSVHKTQLFHATNYAIESFDIPLIATVHDLSCFRFPETHPANLVKWLSENLSPTLEHARHIIAVSYFTKTELISLLGVPEKKITVIPLGISPRFRPQEKSVVFAKVNDYNLEPGGYLLSVGTLEPRKNLLSLIRAYELLPTQLQERFPLVVVGMPGWKDQKIAKGLKTLARKGRLRALGYIPDDSLPDIYAGAALFIYPSIYEGFGFPPLEAMACGVPTVVSNCSSLPEVVGNSGSLIDPHDTDALAKTIKSLLEDSQKLKEMSMAGLRRAKQFTWKACAEKTFKVYQDAIRKTGN